MAEQTGVDWATEFKRDLREFEARMLTAFRQQDEANQAQFLSLRAQQREIGRAMDAIERRVLQLETRRK